MALSSINFQKVSIHCFKHNDRTEERAAKTVHLEYSHKNICDTDSKAAAQNFNDLYKNSISKITGRERRADKKNTIIEAVVNIKPNTTLEDLKELQKHIEKEFGFTGLQIAIHKDEGHYEDGKFITNDHAHLSFFTLNRENGRQMFRREHISRDKLSKLQDKTAELLQMDRGQKVEVSARKRLNHKDYKQAKKQELAKIKDLAEEITKLRTELKENKATRSDYAELEALNRNLKLKIKAKDLTVESLNVEINNLRQELANGNNAYEKTRSEAYELELQVNSLKTQKNDLLDKMVELEEKNDSRPNMEDYEAILKEKEKYVNAYEKNLAQIKDLNSSLGAKQKSREGLFGWIKDKFEAFKEEILGLKAENTSLKQQIKALELDNQSIKTKLEKVETENSELLTALVNIQNLYRQEENKKTIQNESGYEL